MNQQHFTVTNILIAVFTVFFIVTVFFSMFVMKLGGIHGIDSVTLIFFGGYSFDTVLIGQLWRLWTSGFLHGNLIHFLFNSYAMYMIGNLVEQYYGKKKLLLIFLITVITGSFFAFGDDLIRGIIFNDTYFAVSIGASGGIFGLLGLLIGNKLRRNTYTQEIPIDFQNLLVIVGVNLFIGFTVANINNAAHIGGLIGGIILGLILSPLTSYDETELEKSAVNLLYYISIFGIIFSFIINFIVSYSYL